MVALRMRVLVDGHETQQTEKCNKKIKEDKGITETQQQRKGGVACTEAWVGLGWLAHLLGCRLVVGGISGRHVWLWVGL
jgi:hypothetical protein